MTFEILCDIYRFSNCHFMEPESDAEHTIRMQLKLLDIINELYNGGVSTLPFNFEKLLYNILIHDTDEALLCDFPKNIKYYDEEIRSKIGEITKELFHNSNVSNKLILDITSDLKSDTIIEGLLLRYLDIESAVDKLRKESILQPYDSHIKEIFMEAKSHMEWYLNNKLDLIKDPDLHKIIEDRINERIR